MPLGAIFGTGAAFLRDRMLALVCRRARARRCRMLRGRDYRGSCAAKPERFFGRQLPLVCTATGVPMAFDRLPDTLHDLTPVHALTDGVPAGAARYRDKA